ncbi:MAG: hypothetical protein HY303_00725 [Candidatus Wallbacteria bacterium]|nr:hypothetical protein [Candidatus Wallbacteria bacterium]
MLRIALAGKTFEGVVEQASGQHQAAVRILSSLVGGVAGLGGQSSLRVASLGLQNETRIVDGGCQQEQDVVVVFRELHHAGRVAVDLGGSRGAASGKVAVRVVLRQEGARGE